MPESQIDIEELLRHATEMIEDLRRRGATPGVPVGDTPPGFTLPDAHGRPVALADLLARGPVVVAFYRGAWCPVCNRHLHELQSGLDEIRARGATLVAISPQAPDDSLAFAEKLELGYDVLSDLDQSVMADWGLQFDLPDALRAAYPALGMDLGVHNADGTWRLPVPATFVLDRSGVVRARHVDPNYRERMSLEDVLSALDDVSVEAAGHAS